MGSSSLKVFEYGLVSEPSIVLFKVNPENFLSSDPVSKIVVGNLLICVKRYNRYLELVSFGNFKVINVSIIVLVISHE